MPNTRPWPARLPLKIETARKLPLICGPVCQGGRTKRRPDGFSGAASSGRLRVDVVACVSVRDGAVMLICAGWLPQDGAVRLERFCWSSGSFPVSVILARVALYCRGFRVGAVLPKWCSAGGCAVSYTHLRAHETRHDLVCR